MTYKSTSEIGNYINRVASHSTKPRPSGRIDDIPPWAKEPEEYYNSIRDRYRTLADQLIDVQNKLTTVNLRLRETLPLKDFDHLKQHKERLAARAFALQTQANEYRPLARAAGERAWATVFYLVARTLLPKDDFMVLLKETEIILGRNEVEIKAGFGMKSEPAREAEREHKRRQMRRANWRKHQTGSVTVWADNKPVLQKYADEMRNKKT